MNATRVSQHRGAKFGGRLASRQKNHPAHQPVLLPCNRRRNGAVIISAIVFCLNNDPDKSMKNIGFIEFDEYTTEDSYVFSIGFFFIFRKNLM